MTTANVTDLRSYLAVLEQAGELSRVRVPVSLEQEIGAICLRNLRAGGPGLLFERPGDRAMPLAVDLLASRRRYALALGIEAGSTGGRVEPAHQQAASSGYCRARGVPRKRPDR